MCLSDSMLFNVKRRREDRNRSIFMIDLLLFNVLEEKAAEDRNVSIR